MRYIQILQKRVIYRDAGVPYLIRWNLFGLGKDSSWFSVKIHNIVKSDDICLHDHPWAFISIILKGGYTEYARHDHLAPVVRPGWSEPRWSEPNHISIQHRYFKSGSILFRRANWSHSLEVKEPTWTLVFTFRKTRLWGFITRRGWLPHYKYSKTRDC